MVATLADEAKLNEMYKHYAEGTTVRSPSARIEKSV